MVPLNRSGRVGLFVVEPNGTPNGTVRGFSIGDPSGYPIENRNHEKTLDILKIIRISCLLWVKTVLQYLCWASEPIF